MPLASCARCGRMFNKTSISVCAVCLPDEEADRDKVREALAEDDSLNVEAVAEVTGVDLEVVQRMMKDGIITAATMDIGEVKCGRCGKPAISAAKRLCQECLDKMNQEVAQAQAKIQLGAKKSVQIDTAYGGVHKSVSQKRRI